LSCQEQNFQDNVLAFAIAPLQPNSSVLPDY
jgi:hypothetical protein